MLDFWRAYGWFCVGVGVWVLPRREWDVVWCGSRVLFIKMVMEDVEDLAGF